MKTYGELAVYLHAYLTSALDDMSNQFLAPFSSPPPLRPQSRSGHCEEEKNLLHCTESNTDSLVIEAINIVGIPTELWPVNAIFRTPCISAVL
jgi:hypothetical protein